MKDEILESIQLFFRDIKTNKKKLKIVGIFLILIIFFTAGMIGKFNSNKVIECAKSRNSYVEGETLSSLIYSGLKEIEKGPYKIYGKVVYLTIDDGPSEYTDKILKILEDNDARATFFMIEGNMKAYPQQVKNIAKSENTAGFHSVSHDINKLYSSTNSAKKEFDINKKTYQYITGETSTLIRLPFGSKPYTPRDSYNSLKDAGYKLWDWTLDTEDWRSTSPQILATLKRNSKQCDNIILLMHERKQTVDILDSMLKYLKSQGFEMVAIQENEEPRNYWNDKLFSKGN